MKTRFAQALAAAAFLLVTACSHSSPAPDPAPRTEGAPSPTRDQTDLVAALRRTQGVPHRFTVDADLPKSQHLQGTGAFDVTKLQYTSSTELSDPKNPSALDRIVVGTDYYQREPGESWIHVDLRRLKEDSRLHFAMADATGLLQFADAITDVRKTDAITDKQKTGPTTYTGRFRPDTEDFTEPFLPIGAPSLWSIGMRVSPFTVTVDTQGWVTAITMELTPTDSPTLRMEAKLSEHGKPLDVERPTAQEADDTLYE